MTVTDRHILETFAASIRHRYPDARVWAFGSRARGDAAPDSDMDICIVLSEPVTRAIKDWIGDVAWEVGFEADRIITALAMDRRDFEDGPRSASPLVANILRDGVAA